MKIQNRTITLKSGENVDGPVIYWMSRDQRAENNWALLSAQAEAMRRKLPLFVVFCLVDQFPGSTLRAYDFMLRGLSEVEEDLAAKNIPMFLLKGSPEKKIPEFCQKNSVSSIYTDFDPLRIKRRWQRSISLSVKIPFYLTDAHNIVPCWEASVKKEFAARTFRPRIRKKLPDYLKPFPPIVFHQYNDRVNKGNIGYEKLLDDIRVDRSVPPVNWLTPGTNAGKHVLEDFVNVKLRNYPDNRNDPNRSSLSNLSPYFHFGQISTQETALKISGSLVDQSSIDTFLEEMIVRRELSDNFCFYEPEYDKISAFPDWSLKTLEEHRNDSRVYIYDEEKLEKGLTHDPLWNAAQIDLIKTGKLHGWIRMYWAKKILEWTESPEFALNTAQKLNDKYELDGRDPNGFTGVAWAIGGVHDRAWPSHNVYGKIRYMNFNGAKRKFNVEQYIRKVTDQ